MAKRNQDTIDELIEFKELILKSNDTLEPLQKGSIKNLKLDHSGSKTRLMLGDRILTANAVRAVANKFNIKPKFFQLGKTLGTKELENITTKLKFLTDMDCLLETNESKIENIIFEFPKSRRKGMENIGVIENLDRIIEALNISYTKYDIAKKLYSRNGTVSLELNSENSLDVLSNDPWCVGIQTDFSRTHFNINPFLLRKICTNGMVAHEYGFQSNISQMKWNSEKVDSKILQLFFHPEEKMNEEVIRNVNMLTKYNISLAELNQTKNALLDCVSDETHALSLISKYYNTDYEKYYGDLTEKSNQFLKTADTGINAYDHFNSITWITSHLNETRLSTDEALNLNVRASNLLFKANELNLSQIAPKINF